MKLITTLSFSIVLIISAKAQEYKLSLSEAIDIGLKNKIALKNQQLSVNLAENEEAKTRTKNLPQVTASFDARVNTQLQTQVISPEATGGNPNADPIRAQFGTKYYNVLALNANQNIFNPGVRYDKKLNAERTELERLNLEKSETDAILSISEAYWDAAFKKVKWEASKLNYDVARDKFLRGQMQFKNGTKLKIDLDKEKLDERNALQSYRNDSSQYQLAVRYLANELNLPLTATLQLTELTGKADAVEISIDDVNTANRVEVRTELRQLSIYELSKDKQKLSYWPTVSLFANYTLQQFNNSFDPTNGKFWTHYNYIGVRLEIPVFDGLLKQKNKQEFEYRIAQSNNNLAQLNQQIAYEIQSAKWEYENAESNYTLASENYEIAKEILKTDLVRLEAGTILSVEAKNSEYAMLTAQTNYLNGLYQYLLARLRLQKALGVVSRK
jgi:outer membrane protein TolC